MSCSASVDDTHSGTSTPEHPEGVDRAQRPAVAAVARRAVRRSSCTTLQPSSARACAASPARNQCTPAVCPMCRDVGLNYRTWMAANDRDALKDVSPDGAVTVAEARAAMYSRPIAGPG